MCLKGCALFASFVRKILVTTVLVVSVTAVLSSAEQTLIRRTFVSKEGVKSAHPGSRLDPKGSSAISCARQCLTQDCFGAHFSLESGECFAVDYPHLYNTTMDSRWTLMSVTYDKVGPIRHVAGLCVMPQEKTQRPSDNSTLILDNCNSFGNMTEFGLVNGYILVHIPSRMCVSIQQSEPSDEQRLSLQKDCSAVRERWEWTTDGSVKLRGTPFCVHPFEGQDSPANGTELTVYASCGFNRIRFDFA